MADLRGVDGAKQAAAAPPPVTEPAAVRALITPLYEGRQLRTGEPFAQHADGMVDIVRALRPDADLLCAGYLFGAHEVLRNADDWLRERLGPEVLQLVNDLRQLMRLSELTRQRAPLAGAAAQSEALRKMLLAMVNDVRVVLLRLASRVQTLRYYAARKGQGVDADLQQIITRETLDLYAPLASRLGVWQIKWELEDLAFRLLEPQTYKELAHALDEKRGQREQFIADAVVRIRTLLRDAGIVAEVSGRPKHIASIWNKMRTKQLAFDQVLDVRGLRIIVDSLAQCYQALALLQAAFEAIDAAYDDYIARPKANGYQSLHTVVRDDAGRPIEIQIRTRAMHEAAELGVAAHWRYKEGAGKSAKADAQRIAWLRQLLAWRDEVDAPHSGGVVPAERIYVLTPAGRVVELPAGSTPVDFAYHVHTDLGHRCRGARVDGQLVPLNRPLANGQTVDVIVGKQGGPSRDWLNPELGYLAGARARQKVRHWFNQRELEQSSAAGRAVVERELQRLGKTAVKLDDLAQRLGFDKLDELFVAASKEEFSLRSIEHALVGTPAPVEPELPALFANRPREASAVPGKGRVLVVGVDSLLTQLARCCRPVPPDDIVGFVTRGRGVSIHRSGCSNAAALARRHGERVIEVAWGGAPEATYPVDIVIVATDRNGLLRDISEVFAREKLNVVGASTATQRGEARMQFTVEVSDAASLRRALAQIGETPGVYAARRR